MKKYIIEVSDDCMEYMQKVKADRSLKSISKVIEWLGSIQQVKGEHARKIEKENSILWNIIDEVYNKK